MWPWRWTEKCGSTKEFTLGHDDATAGIWRRQQRGLFLGKLLEEEINEGSRLGAPRGATDPQANEKDQRFEDVGVAEMGIAHMLLFGLAELLKHLFHLGGNGEVRAISERLLIVQPGSKKPFAAGAHGRKRGDEVAIIEAAVGLRGVRQRIAEAHEEMFVLVWKLIGYFHLQEQCGRIELIGGARALVLVRL